MPGGDRTSPGPSRRPDAAVLHDHRHYRRCVRRDRPGAGRKSAFGRRLSSLASEKVRDEDLQQIEIELKYEGYIKRQHEQAEKFNRFEEKKIPADLDYEKLRSISAEGREKLERVRPDSIGQASRISGVTPSDISVLMVYLGT